MKKDAKFYWQLFIYTFQISAFTFGGGFVIVSLMKKRFVDQLGWIDEDEMLDFVAIAQSAPGAIAVNASTLLGYNLAGLKGALVAILGTILPPLILLTLLSFGYKAFIDNPLVQNILRGMQAGVAAVILDVVISMTSVYVKAKRWIAILLIIIAFAAVALLKINVILVILTYILIGVMMIAREKREASAL